MCKRGDERRYVPHKDDKIGVWGPLGGNATTTVVLREKNLSGNARGVGDGNPAGDFQLFMSGTVRYGDFIGNEYATDFEFFTIDIYHQGESVKMITPQREAAGLRDNKKGL
jgi:hypothetical protein